MLDDVETLEVAQDDEGHSYIPPYSVNTIGDVDFSNGYQVFYTSAENDTIINEGPAIQPDTMMQSLNNSKLFMIAYPYQSVHPVTEVFSSIHSSVVVVQDDAGTFWIPGYGVNTIGDMAPGKGYQIYVNSDVEFTYPALSGELPKRRDVITETMAPKHFTYRETGLSYAILVTGSDEELQRGDEVGVYSGDRCVGAGVYTGTYPIVIAAWKGIAGHGMELPGYKDGDAISCRLWHSKSGDEKKMGGMFESPEEAYYGRGAGMSALQLVMDEGNGLGIVPHEFCLGQNYPNPFNPETRIEYQVARDARVKIGIYNLMGQEICRLVNEDKTIGVYRVLWDGRDRDGLHVSSGVYIVRMEAADYLQTRKILLVQ